MHRPSSSRLAALLLVLPALASAHSISNELGAAVTQPTMQNPRTGNLYNVLSASFDLSETLSLGVDLGLTLDPPMRAQNGSSFGSSGGRVFSSALLLDFLANDHLSLTGSLDFSPRSQTESATTVLFTDSTGATTTADALLRSVSSSLGAGLGATYSTAGDSDFELTLDGSASFSRYNTVQSITMLETPRGTVSASELISFCNNASTLAAWTLCRALLPVLRAEPASLSQLRLSLGVIGTLFGDTDLGLGGTYYLYDKDPTQVGYFSLLTFGRTARLGDGMPVAPVRFTLGPSVSHRFGDLSADLSYSYSHYMADLGSGHSFALKLAYQLGRSFKLWLRPSLQLDVQPGWAPTRSLSLSGGARYSF